MSDVSFMEKLLDGVDVEWRPLKKVTHQTKNIKWQDTNLNYRYIDLTSVCKKRKLIIETSEISAKNAPSRAQKLIEENDVLFATTRPIQQRYTLVNNEFSGQIASTGYCILRAKIDEVLPKWILYNISSDKFNNFVEENQSGAAYPAISDTKVKAFKIPIPCPNNPEKSLEIQTEIVRILDTFTELTTELTTELSARKKQYNYYRDQLLNFDLSADRQEGEAYLSGRQVEWKTLGDICVIGDGLHGTPKYDDNGEYYFINGNNLDNGKIVFNDKTRKVNDSMFKKHGILFTVENTVFLSINGTIGSVSFYNNENIVLGKSVAFFNIKSPEFYSRYLFYFLQTDFSKKYFEAQKTGSTIKNLGLKALRAFSIPIPPLIEQKRIVAILDKFDTLTHSISEGLPREIELRQKQYAYYRDLLLSFPKQEADVMAGT